jgi:hypothetical protein
MRGAAFVVSSGFLGAGGGGLRALGIFFGSARPIGNVRFALIADESMRCKSPPLCAMSGLMHRSKRCACVSLFDHLVGAQKE